MGVLPSKLNNCFGNKNEHGVLEGSALLICQECKKK